MTMLSTEQIRELCRAAKHVSQLVIQAAVHEHEMHSQNVFAFLKGRDSALSLAKQLSMLRIFGFDGSGKLLHELHSWVVKDLEGLDQLKMLMRYESTVDAVTISPAYTQDDVPSFIGVYVEFQVGQAPEPDRDVRIIVTLMPCEIAEQQLTDALMELFSHSSRPPQRGISLGVTQVTMRNVWRARTAPSTTKLGRYAQMKRTANLPFNQDIEGADMRASPDQIKTVLMDVTRRLETVLQQQAASAQRSISHRDRALLRRAHHVLEG